MKMSRLTLFGFEIPFLGTTKPIMSFDTRCQVWGDPHICWILLGRPSILHSPFLHTQQEVLDPMSWWLFVPSEVVFSQLAMFDDTGR
jgi:hypothetical protein